MNGSGSLRHHSEQQHPPCPGTRGAAKSLALPMVGYSAFLLQLWVSAETPIDTPGWKPRKPIISKSGKDQAWWHMLRNPTVRRQRQVDHEFSVSLQYRVKLWPQKRLFACLFKIKNCLLKARVAVVRLYFYIIKTVSLSSLNTGPDYQNSTLIHVTALAFNHNLSTLLL